MIYFIIWAALHVLGLAAILSLNGQGRKGKYSFTRTCVLRAVDIALMYLWGAFDFLV